jgi:hypothetical protein
MAALFISSAGLFERMMVDGRMHVFMAESINRKRDCENRHMCSVVNIQKFMAGSCSILYRT